ncbi:hypothetical protein FQR65_LT11074 [Abscondita terminalis]|nr:hypothetical protein FQR65_LT11074 [Abscondita terminalis]
MQIPKEELHSEVSSIHDVYRNYDRLKADNNLLQRKYKSCLLTLKTTRSEVQTLKENYQDIYVTKNDHDIVVKEYEALQQRYASLKNDYDGVILKCEELTKECKRNNVKTSKKTVKGNEILDVPEQNLDELQRKYKLLLNSSHEFNKEYLQLYRKVKSLDLTVQEMKESNSDYKEKLSDMTEKNECLFDKLSRFNGVYYELLKQRNALEVEVKDLKKQLVTMKSEGSFDLQKKYDSLLMDIRQIFQKYQKIVVDTQPGQLVTEEKVCCSYEQNVECDSIACDNVINKYKTKEVINDGITLEQSIQDTIFSEDDELLKLIFESTKCSVWLLSPIPSPIPKEQELLSISDVDKNNEIPESVEEDMLIEEQRGWSIDEDLLLSSSSSDTIHAETSDSDAESVQSVSKSETLRTLDSNNQSFYELNNNKRRRVNLNSSLGVEEFCDEVKSHQTTSVKANPLIKHELPFSKENDIFEAASHFIDVSPEFLVDNPEFNLVSLRSLLFNYDGFSSDEYNLEQLFKNLLQYYLDKQKKCAQVLIIALSNHLSIKFLVEEVFPTLFNVSPTKDVQSFTAALSLVMLLNKHLYGKMGSADFQKNIEWVRHFSTELYPYSVREHANQLLQLFS